MHTRISKSSTKRKTRVSKRRLACQDLTMIMVENGHDHALLTVLCTAKLTPTKQAVETVGGERLG